MRLAQYDTHFIYDGVLFEDGSAIHAETVAGSGVIFDDGTATISANCL